MDFSPSTTVTHHIITISIIYRRQDVCLIYPPVFNHPPHLHFIHL